MTTRKGKPATLGEPAAVPRADGVTMGSHRTAAGKTVPAVIEPSKAVSAAIAPSKAVTTAPASPARPSVPPSERDSYAATAFGDIVDRSLHAAIARLPGGCPPQLWSLPT
ncbi:MAG TPA: hypothetical protein P5114_09140, partial [Hyphomicrobiaceae bacterium]|nr:hypothetical protein [Hyphomicrobiaceae bacterium]